MTNKSFNKPQSQQSPQKKGNNDSVPESGTGSGKADQRGGQSNTGGSNPQQNKGGMHSRNRN